jgi:deoxyribonuclease IV
MKRKLGGHLSTAGGPKRALERTLEIGGSALQIFSTSPRSWRHASITSEVADGFKKDKEVLNIEPVYFHASYLINLADQGETGKRSVDSLVAELDVAHRMGIKGSVVHPGSFKDKDLGNASSESYKVLFENIARVLQKTPEETMLIVENSGTRKIGRRLEEIEMIVKAVKNKRLKVCLDTCHLHAAGYDISSEDKLNKFLSEFNERIGLDRLEVIHVNDSLDDFGSLRDRHANIKEGKIDPRVFELILNHKDLKQLPFIIETPGFDGRGPDKKNIDRLKDLVR